jgi:hypothetical protein
VPRHQRAEAEENPGPLKKEEEEKNKTARSWHSFQSSFQTKFRRNSAKQFFCEK